MDTLGIELYSQNEVKPIFHQWTKFIRIEESYSYMVGGGGLEFTWGLLELHKKSNNNKSSILTFLVLSYSMRGVKEVLVPNLNWASISPSLTTNYFLSCILPNYINLTTYIFSSTLGTLFLAVTPQVTH